jgi:hypothetical protein
VNPKTVGKAVSAGRLAFGVAMMAAPKLVMAKWVGDDEIERPPMDMITRSLGAREVLLGFIGLHVAERKGVNKRTWQSMAFLDATDLTVTALHAKSLPKPALPIMVAVAGGAVVAQLWAANEVD